MKYIKELVGRQAKKRERDKVSCSTNHYSPNVRPQDLLDQATGSKDKLCVVCDYLEGAFLFSKGVLLEPLVLQLCECGHKGHGSAWLPCHEGRDIPSRRRWGWEFFVLLPGRLLLFVLGASSHLPLLLSLVVVVLERVLLECEMEEWNIWGRVQTATRTRRYRGPSLNERQDVKLLMKEQLTRNSSEVFGLRRIRRQWISIFDYLIDFNWFQTPFPRKEGYDPWQCQSGTISTK